MKKTTGKLVPTHNVLVDTEMNKPMFFYGTKTEKRKNKTITRRVAYAGVQVTSGAIRIGKAVCSNRDKFVKSKGRAIAAGRAASTQPENVIYLTDDFTPIQAFLAHVSKQVDPKPKKKLKISVEEALNNVN